MATSPSLHDQIMELEAQKQKLMAQAKSEALTMAERGVNDLNNLGFHYRLVETDTTAPPRTATKTPTTRSPRAGGISEQVLAVVKAAPDGLKRAMVLEQMQATDPKVITSITNALSNLKGKFLLTLENGVYRAA